jgi:hypothetical protein
MAAASLPTRLSDDFNAFLRSALWLDRDDSPLSVLSALARLDVDPWEEAAQLAALPKPSASEKLASMLANLPGGPAVRRDLDLISERAVALLSSPAGSEQKGGAPLAIPTALSRPLIFLVLGSLVMALTLIAAQGDAGGQKPPLSAHPALPPPAVAPR